MGSRANFVLIDDRGWRLFFAKSAGQEVHRLLAPGPGCARRFIEAQRECAPDEGWLDDRWAEGAALVDLTRQCLLFFTTHMYGLTPLRGFLHLLRHTWPGWTVDWAFGGLADLTTHLGLGTDLVRDLRLIPNLTNVRALGTPPVAEDWALLTVRRRSGVVAWPTDTMVDLHYAWGGRRLARSLPRRWDRRAVPDVPPDYGIHLDLAERRMGWWTTDPVAGLELIPARWPGWRVEFWQDRYEHHVSECEGQVALPSVDERRCLAAAEDGLRDILDGRPRYVDVRPDEADVIRHALAELRAESA